jgi:hypothetical protein
LQVRPYTSNDAKVTPGRRFGCGESVAALHSKLQTARELERSAPACQM